MKKFITLTLVFVMVLAFAMPAMAFTDKVPAETVKVPYELDIYLVEAEDEDEFGMAVYTLPPTDRGYAKNEIICAVAKLYIPKGQYPVADDGYRNFNMIGKNVRLATIDNMLFMKKSTNWTAKLEDQWDLKSAPTVADLDAKIKYTVNMTKVTASGDGFYDKDKDRTYAASFFGKVTGDDAFMAVEFTKGIEFTSATATGTLATLLDTTSYKWLNVGDYVVVATGTPGQDEVFTIFKGKVVADIIAANQLFRVNTAKKNASKSLDVYYNGSYAAPAGWWTVSESAGEFVFSAIGDARISKASGSSWTSTDIDRLNAQSVEADANASRVHGILTDLIENGSFADFGFTWANIGNVVEKKTFESIANEDDLYAEVAVLPWYAYVEVPPAIVVDPPKTGDVMSVVGFALIALAGLAVVAIRKVRA